MKTVGYRKSAVKGLRKLPADVQQAIVGKLDRYAETGAGDVTQLQGRPGSRLRYRSYRAIFIETDDTIDVLEIGARKDIY